MASNHVRRAVEENFERGAPVPDTCKTDRNESEHDTSSKPYDMDGEEARRKAAARARAGVKAADKLGAFLLVAAGAAAWLYSTWGQGKSAPDPQKKNKEAHHE